MGKKIIDLKSLGATEDDIQMLKDISSDIEESNEFPDQNLLNDIRSFMSKDLQMTLPDTKKELKKVKAEKKNELPKEKALKTEKSIKKNELPKEKSVKNAIQKTSESTKKLEKSKGNKLFIEPTSQWHSIPLNAPASPQDVLSDDQIQQLYEKAKGLHERECDLYSKTAKLSSGDKEFIQTVLQSGTVTDKVSALTLLVQESPIHSLHLLEKNLFWGMAKKKSRREALMAVDSIKELLVTCLLPDRKLSYFRDQPLQGATDQHLILWFFEDSLKKFYFEFLKLLEELTKDVLVHIKSKMIVYLQELLVAKPEQEQNVLALLINKMGDLERKIASKVVFLLLKTISIHPNMKMVIIQEVERLIFRPNMPERTIYYAVTMLNQIPLFNNDTDSEVANHLIGLYFSLFENLSKKVRKEKEEPIVKKKGKKQSKNQPSQKKPQDHSSVDGLDAKMMSALLVGVSRAYPYSQMDETAFEDRMNVLFLMTHIGTFNVAVQALNLIYQVQNSKQSLSDRFYRALYESLLDNRLPTSSKHSIYLNLLYRALKNDVSNARTRAFIKRMIQICGQVPTPFVCAMLFLISEIAKTKPCVWSLISSPEEDEEETFRDMDDENEPVTQLKTEKNSVYDPLKREPMFANAEKTCIWELIAYTQHFHPTVALYASTLLSATPIAIPTNCTNYDPLQNHTLQRFLDRFVYKNPKKVDNLQKGSSLMQPRGILGKTEDMLVAGGKKRNVILNDVDRGLNCALDDQAVNVVDYRSKTETSVPVDELFFYHYFKQRDVKAQVNPRDELDSDAESLDEEEVWEAMRTDKKFPKELEMEEDDDDDLEIEHTASEEEDSEALDVEAMDGLKEEGDSDISSDNEMATLFQDELSQDEDDMLEEEEEEKKPKKGKKAAELLAKKAKSLGYSGGYFDSKGSLDTFASADDFMTLIDRADEEEQSDEPQEKKRKSTLTLKSRKKNRRS